MKITSVTIEGMHNVTKPITYQLEDFNYLVGKNGAGKSTVLQGLQLAILGYIPGTAKTNIAIMEHANGQRMRVKVEFDNDTSIERSWANAGKAINAISEMPAGYDPKDVLGELELPIFNFSEFLGLTANKAKDWFMNFLPGIDSEIDWTKQLTDSVRDFHLIDTELINNTVQELSSISGDDTVDMIRKCNEALKADLSFSKGELQKLQGTIQSLIYYDDISSGDPASELDEIKKQLSSISTAESALRSYQSAVESNNRIASLLETLPELPGDSPADNSQYVSLVKERDELKIKLDSLTDESTETSIDVSGIDAKIEMFHEELSKLIAVINNNEKVINGKGVCPYTSQPCDSIKVMIDNLSSESAEAQAKIDEIKSSIAQLNSEKDEIIQKFNAVSAEKSAVIHDCKLNISAIEGRISAIERDYKTRDSYTSQLVEVPFIEEIKSFEEYQVMKDALIERSNKLAANAKYNELIESLTADKYKIENTIEAYKVWIKLTGENGLQTSLMEEPFTEFESDMNIFIHESFGDDIDCKFNLSTKANSFSYGILRNHQFIPYNLLSSGEKAMYTFALMRCIVSGYDSPLKLLVVDDVSDHLDDSNLKSTFESLNNTEGIQIVLAGVNTIESMPGNVIEVH